VIPADPSQLGQPRHGHHRNTMAADPEDAFRKQYEAGASLGRVGGVDDIAPAVVFLASDDSKWITGESLYITGGFR
jgi:NAD(P)-dependent dehydrogenase (short-subunit alcohol dehydrogenase family)